MTYQNDFRIVPSEEEEVVPSPSPLHLFRLRLGMAVFACVAMGSLLNFGSPSSDSEEASVGYSVSLWGSGHKHSKHKHHHKHHHEQEKDQYSVFPGLQLPGYPSLEEQQQYLQDVQGVDWDEVEADLEALMTDSQDCKRSF